jgi:phage baseplate assembly protein W
VAQGRPIYRYEPNTSNPDRAVGVLLPFNKSSDGRTVQQNELSGSVGGGSLFVQSYTTEEQALSNFRNLLMTRLGERYMQPNFGTKIQDFVFEQNTELFREELQLSIQDAISTWLPYIETKQIDVIEDVANYSVSVRIRFVVKNSEAERVIIVLANENELLVSDVDIPLELVPVGTFNY